LSEFEGLDSKVKLTYISDAIEELRRAKVPDHARGWHSLFSQTLNRPAFSGELRV